MDESQHARKAQVAELLLKAARHLGETLEPERVYERFHELLGDIVPHDGLVVSSYDDREDLIRCDYAWVEGSLVDPATLPALPLNRSGGGMQSRVIVTGEPYLFNDVVAHVQQVEGVYYNVDSDGTIEEIGDSEPPGTTAAMMVPVKHEGSVVGVVQVMTDAGAYSEDQLELVEGLVGQMAAAVRNARLLKERVRLESAEAAAQAVAAEREQAAQVLEAVGDGIVLVDGEGLVLLWNRTAEALTGLRAGDVQGRSLAEILPDWNELAAAIPVAEGGERPRAVTLPVEIGGRSLWLSFVAVRGAAGVVYAFRDLTAERRLEEEKSDLVTTISHELRTPTAAVYGAAETLLHRDADLTEEQRRELLEMIGKQSSRLSQITDEVLLTSSLDRGEVYVVRHAVDVRDVIRSAIDAIGAPFADAPITVEIAGAVGATSGNHDRIKQVLVNLLDNALKYGGSGPVHVRAEATGEVVRISVADSGPGILPADRERIFEKFFRADPQMTYAPSGTGLGLYISRELARHMDGRLTLSPTASGATFVLELPAN
jgi:PAS domain S-box-containing protein